MRRSPHHLLALVVALAAVALPLTARAGAQQSDQDRANKAFQQYDATTKEQEAAKARLSDLQKQQQQLTASLSSLSAQVDAANARLTAAQAAADQADALAAEVQAKVDETVEQIQKAQQDMRESALLLYTQHDGNASSMLSLLTASERSDQVVEGKHYLERVSSKRRRDAARVTKLKEALQVQQAQVAVQKQAADDARNQAAAQKDQLDALVAQQQQSKDAAAANEQQTATLVSKLNDEAASDLAELNAANAAITASLQGSGDSGPSPSGYLRPVPGPVTSGFGYRTDPITGQPALHSGIDFGSPCGTPIKAAATGIVFSVTPEAASGGYGNMTIIKHGGNVATLYGHQSSIIVSPGQPVSMGQVIGYVGSTGKSTGCHLHWEIRINGTPVNPAPYL
jgi:murein DD-endopeptidase MepM/ murein hydrolase activator NlpD